MTNTELILEAVEYSYDEDMPWWDVFDSKAEANRIIGRAIKEEPDDSQIATLISYREELLEEDLTAEENYIYILKRLRRELKETIEE